MLHISAANISGTTNKQAVSQLAKYSAAYVVLILSVPSKLLDTESQGAIFPLNNTVTKRNPSAEGILKDGGPHVNLECE